MRAEQREATREQIVIAALAAISDAGFDGASTRMIAKRANVSQGLLTYHFKSKEILWRAAADYLFRIHNEAMQPIAAVTSHDSREELRELIRRMVSFCAAHPVFTRFMFDFGAGDNERSRWLVEKHLRPLYSQFSNVMVEPRAELPHAFYTIAGASGLIFRAANDCKQTTGLNPKSKAAIKRHGDYLANLIVPETIVQN